VYYMPKKHSQPEISHSLCLPELRDLVKAGDFIKNPDGEIYLITQENSVVLNGVRCLQLYYR